MRRTFVLGLAGLLSLVAPAAHAHAANSDRIVERPDLQPEFASRGTVGTMVVKQTGRTQQTVIVGEPRSHARYLPSSCIPIYQRIAREVGPAAYQAAVRALRYGNRRVSAAPVDSFWLGRSDDQSRFVQHARTRRRTRRDRYRILAALHAFR